jgi:D-amino peptidase
VRIYISVDMKGISGVTRWEDVVTGGQDYQRARSWMTHDVNAAVAGARAAGATDFVVEENHGVEMLTNLLLDELDPEVDVVRGFPRPGITTMAALDSWFDAMFLIGHHAKVGDYPGIGAHTISFSEYADVRLEGRTVGEGEIFALAAAQEGVPTVLITGDDVVCAEMAKAVPGIEEAVVKEAMSRTGGRIIPPVRAQRIIGEAAQRATQRVADGEISLPDVHPPFAMEVELRRPLSDEALRQVAQHHELRVIGDRTVAFTCDRMDAAYSWAASVQILATGKPPWQE